MKKRPVQKRIYTRKNNKKFKSKKKASKTIDNEIISTHTTKFMGKFVITGVKEVQFSIICNNMYNLPKFFMSKTD